MKELGYDEHKDEQDEFWLPLSHCHSNHHGGFYPSCTLGLIIFSSCVSQLCCLSLPLTHHIDWHEPISKTLIATEPLGTHFLPLFSERCSVVRTHNDTEEWILLVFQYYKY